MAVPRSVELKRKRANEHLRRLKVEVIRCVTELNSEGFRRDQDPETGDHIWLIDAPEAVTERTSVLAGDFIHNLRSVLDHIVWALASDRERRPLPEFPIYEHEGPGDNGFYPAGIMKIRSLPPDAKVIIESLQPYKGGNQALLDIQRLDNTDKHRRLLASPYHLRGSTIFLPSQEITAPDGRRIVFTSLSKLRMTSGRLNNGDEFFRVGAGNDPALVEQMGLNLSFRIALDEKGISGAGEIVTKCTKLYEFVEQVVLSQFKPLWRSV